MKNQRLVVLGYTQIYNIYHYYISLKNPFFIYMYIYISLYIYTQDYIPLLHPNSIPMINPIVHISPEFLKILIIIFSHMHEIPMINPHCTSVYKKKHHQVSEGQCRCRDARPGLGIMQKKTKIFYGYR